MNTNTNKELLIRNMDAKELYYKANGTLLKDFLELEKDENENRWNELNESIHSFENKDIILDKDTSRFSYTGTIADSLLTRKLRQVIKDRKDKSAIKVKNGVEYTDLIVNLKFNNPIMIADDTQRWKYVEETDDFEMVETQMLKQFISKRELRRIAYCDGVTINGIHYVNFQRTSSKARTGNCLFIADDYFQEMNDWQNMSIPFGKLKNADIVGIRSYQSLTSSSIVGELDIDPYSILLIDDAFGQASMECKVCKLDATGKNVIVETENYTQKTDLWDGQSLLDKSLFDGTEYEGYGFILLRNHFFKTAVFNTNLQSYFNQRFSSIETATVMDAFGNEIAVKDIKMVTTRNSCKFFKFADIICEYVLGIEIDGLSKIEKERLVWDWWRAEIKSQKQKFGCCKTEHKSKFGDKQQLWYQVIGSLNLDKDQLIELTKNQIAELQLMKKSHAWFKKIIGTNTSSISDQMMFDLLEKNDDIARTKWFTDYRHEYFKNIEKRLISGKILIDNSDFCTLVANPFEMLRASCGDVIDSSIINDYECYCPRYADGEELYGMRSPHICSGNNALLTNVQRDEWKWFNFTDNILIINFWDKGAFLSPKWNGNDTDSDSSYIGNNPIILDEVKKVQDYLIPINDVPQITKKYKYTNDEMAKVDAQLCNDYIGKICNFARDLQSLYWHLYNKDSNDPYLEKIYDDICLLEVLSNIAIDSAKRKYDCSVSKVMTEIKSRDYMVESGIIFDGSVTWSEKRLKKYVTEQSVEDYRKAKYDSLHLDDEMQIKQAKECMDSAIKTADKYIVKPSFVKNLKSKPKRKKKYIANETPEQKESRIEKEKQIAKEDKERDAKIYVKQDSPMDFLKAVVQENKGRCDRTDMIKSIVDLLAPVPQGVKAKNERYEKVIENCIDNKLRLDRNQFDLKCGKIGFEEFYKEKNQIEKNIINDISNRKLNIADVIHLINACYDQYHPVKSHGRYVVDENGKQIYADKRNEKLVENKACGMTARWLYMAQKDLFLDAFVDGVVSSVVEIDAKSDDAQYELNGKKYKIVTKKYEELKEVC